MAANKIMRKRIRVRLSLPVQATDSAYDYPPRKWRFSDNLPVYGNGLWLNALGKLCETLLGGGDLSTETASTKQIIPQNGESGSQSGNNNNHESCSYIHTYIPTSSLLEKLDKMSATSREKTVAWNMRMPADLNEAFEEARQKTAPGADRTSIVRALVQDFIEQVAAFTPPAELSLDHKGNTVTKIAGEDAETERYLGNLKADWHLLEIDTKRKHIQYACKHGFLEQLKATVDIEIELIEETTTEPGQLIQRPKDQDEIKWTQK